jgi:hypothetical protein
VRESLQAPVAQQQRVDRRDCPEHGAVGAQAPAGLSTATPGHGSPKMIARQLISCALRGVELSYMAIQDVRASHSSAAFITLYYHAFGIEHRE